MNILGGVPQHKASLSLVFGVLFFWWPSPHANAGNGIVKLLHPQTAKPITGLQWKNETLPIDDQDRVILEGRFQRRDWTLLWGKLTVRTSAQGDFRIKIPVATISQKPQTFEITAISAFGVVERGQVEISIVQTPLRSHESRLYLAPGATVSSISYSDTWISGYSEIAITAKASARYVFSSQWAGTISGYITLAPLRRSSDETARFLGLNLMAGYEIPGISAPWRIVLSAGGYYTTMFVSGSQFGFVNMMGPLLFPTVQRNFANGRFVVGYIKFSPVGSGLQVLSLSNREFAVGGGYYFPNGGRPLGITLDLASLQAAADDFQFRSLSVSLGLSLGIPVGI